MNLRALRHFVFPLLLTVAACGSSVGPSDDKIRLDLEEFIKEQTRGLVAVTRLDLKRKVLAEDRVQVQMTASYKMNQEEFQKASKAIQVLKANAFGAAGAFELGGAMEKARRLDGQTEEFTVMYRLAGNGLWKITESRAGH
jgi:hypothetical protein